MRRFVLPLGAAVLGFVGWGVLHLTPMGAPVWTSAAARALAEGNAERSVVAADRAVALSPTGPRWLLLGRARAMAGDRAGSRRAYLSATLRPARGVRRDAYHALSGHYLEDAELAPNGDGTPASPPPASAAAAARAAMEGLRLEPGHEGLAWNLFLARRVGGFPEPDQMREELDPTTARMLRAGLASLEARSLRASLQDVVRSLEARQPSQPTEGPPW